MVAELQSSELENDILKVIVASARCRGLSLTGAKKKEKRKTNKKINIGCIASISSEENSQGGGAASAPAL